MGNMTQSTAEFIDKGHTGRYIFMRTLYLYMFFIANMYVLRVNMNRRKSQNESVVFKHQHNFKISLAGKRMLEKIN